MALVNQSRSRVVGMFLGEANRPFTHIGIGTGISPVLPTDTDLTGVQKEYFPNVTLPPIIIPGARPSLEYTVQVEDGQAVYEWKEWGIFTDLPREMLIRVKQDLGRKLPGQVWTFKVQLTFVAERS